MTPTLKELNYVYHSATQKLKESLYTITPYSSTEALSQNTHSPRAQPYPPFSHNAAQSSLWSMTPTLKELNYVYHSATQKLKDSLYIITPYLSDLSHIHH